MDGHEVSPLQEIEHRVQRRAGDLSLDVSGDDGRAKLRALVRDEVEAWSHDFSRGLRAFDLTDPGLVAQRAFRNLAGYGPLEPLLADDDVWEIMINGPDQIFVKRHQGPSCYHDEVFNDDEHVLRTLTKILDDASGSHRKLDPAEGLQDAQLDTGARLHIVHGDVGRDGHVLVNIRKFTGVPYRSLHELVERDMLDTRVADFLRACVRARLSTVFSGAPGSGKTTLLSCCAAELDPSLRVVIAEEVFEADLPLPNVASMQTRPARQDRREVDLRRLVSGFLRMAPDIAVVGEVRDREALPLLLTLSSGVKGFTTIHAGSARQALTRLRFICQLADTSNELPMSALSALVSEAIDIVVHCTRIGGMVRVSEVIAVEESQTGPDATQFTVDRAVRPAGARRAVGLDGEPAGQGGPGAHRGRLRRAFAPRPGRRPPWRIRRPDARSGGHRPAPAASEVAPRRSDGRLMGAVLVALAGAAGVFLLYTSLVLGWKGLGIGPASTTPRHRPQRAQQWLAQAGLDDVQPAEFLWVMALLFVLGTGVTFALFGSPLPAMAVGAFAATYPVASYRARRRRRRRAAAEAWPRMIEEIALLTGSLGRSVPQALFEVGRRGPRR